MGSLINVELPPNCLNHKFLDLVFCIVVAAPSLDHQVEYDLGGIKRITWKSNLKYELEYELFWCGIFYNDINLANFIGSHHVFVENCQLSRYELDYENEISFQFYCDDSTEGYTVEKCGVHLVFAQLPEEANVSFRVDEVEDFVFGKRQRQL
ncbi:hypothetical protein ACOSQ2_009330 [Xanthoceras sorbifolium]